MFNKLISPIIHFLQLVSKFSLKDYISSFNSSNKDTKIDVIVVSDYINKSSLLITLNEKCDYVLYKNNILSLNDSIEFKNIEVVEDKTMRQIWLSKARYNKSKLDIYNNNIYKFSISCIYTFNTSSKIKKQNSFYYLEISTVKNTMSALFKLNLDSSQEILNTSQSMISALYTALLSDNTIFINTKFTVVATICTHTVLSEGRDAFFDYKTITITPKAIVVDKDKFDENIIDLYKCVVKFIETPYQGERIDSVFKLKVILFKF